ncbi:MAG TPA: asparagine synthase (glutamine-hydrolyzing) [Beijerinckiaceae bacterium]|nr:asparagine synthase (glutamine-hydrolyzing) [Beijerinckiaceae bacterium]
MCGIAGWLDQERRGDAADLARVRRMCDTMVHRGPDDDGYITLPGVALGMRRLAIVDISGGHQPMASDDGAIQIVFNGEIFNHDALRSELAAGGTHFRSRSDTEVILRLYEQFGLAAIDRLNGMFAIAIWDGRDKAMHLVRDRMGEKPLYYLWDGRRLLFGSEIKAILAGLDQRPPVNPQALWDFFTFRYVPPDHTIWKSISKLPPAHRLTIRAGGGVPEIARWWDIPRPSHRQRSDSDEVAQFDALLTNATQLRMLADVPVGILLSGGLDSSVVAAKAALEGQRVKTFSVAFEGAEAIDERRYARMVAKAFNTDHHEVVIGEREFVDFLPDFVRFTDEPLADLASIPLHYVCKLARKNVTVVLSGEGSDEILGGYSFDNWAARWDEAATLSKPLTLMERLLRRQAPWVDPGLLDLRDAPQPLTMTSYMTSEEKRALFRAGMEAPDSLDGLRAKLAHFGKASPLAQALYIYCQDWLVEDLLMKADKMSMATSVELRAPFLDHRVVEAAARLPDHLRVGRRADGTYETKRILRMLAAKCAVPQEILTRPKMGFPVPVYGWLSDSLRPFAHDLLASPGTRLNDWCDPAALAAILARGTAPDAPMQDRHVLWNTLILEIWMRSWL